MCGIAGVFRYDGGPLDPDILAAMSSAVSHRGPDGLDQEIQTAGSVRVGLGHARLRIIDLSAAASQPMTSDIRMKYRPH